MFRNFEGCEGSSFTIYFGSCLQNGYMHLCTNYSNLTILLAFCDVILAKFPPPPPSPSDHWGFLIKLLSQVYPKVESVLDFPQCTALKSVYICVWLFTIQWQPQGHSHTVAQYGDEDLKCTITCDCIHWL